MASGITELDWVLDLIESDFPEVEITQEDIDRWVAEVEGGGGRTMDELRADILKYRVGDDAVGKSMRQAGRAENLVSQFAYCRKTLSRGFQHPFSVNHHRSDYTGHEFHRCPGLIEDAQRRLKGHLQVYYIRVKRFQ